MFKNAKNYFLIILIINILCFNFVFAQSYRVIDPAKIRFYLGGYDYLSSIKAIKIDSISVTAGSDTLYYFIKMDYRGRSLDDTCQYYHLAPSWIGKGVLVKADGTNVLFNSRDDSVFIKTNAKINDTWKMYNYQSGGYIEAKATACNFENVKGKPDSVLTITLQVRDSSGKAISHIFNQKAIRISKNNGFVKLFKFYNFPEDTTEFNISPKGIPTVREVNDHNVGDKVQKSIHGFGSMAVEHYITSTILKKILSADSSSVTYTVKNEGLVKLVVQQPQLHLETKVYSDTVISTSSLNDNLITDDMPEESVKQDFYFLSLGYDGLAVFDYPIDFRYQEKNGCWTNIGEGNYCEYTYVEGLGTLKYCSRNEGYEEFVYYKKGNKTWGTQKVASIKDNNYVSEADFVIYPNPVTDYLNVELPQLINNINCNFSVLSMSGKKQIVENSKNGSSVSFNVHCLPSGVYILEINNGIGITRKKFVKK